MDKEKKKTDITKTKFVSEVRMGEEEYHVQTESDAEKKLLVITEINQNGQVVSTRKTNYDDMLDRPDSDIRLQELMLRQHQSAICSLESGHLEEAREPFHYLDELKLLLRKKNNKSAFLLLKDALAHYPDDPFLLSYYGCLESIVEKNHESGIRTCKTAMEVFKEKAPFGEEFFFPFFYLNIGRAYLAAGKRKEAIDSFQKGNEYDSENSEILLELKKLGMRKRPLIPFFRRSNPVNKYIGKILNKMNK